MDLNKVYQELTETLTKLGFTEIEIDLKPKNQPAPHVKVFIACEAPAN